MHDGKSFAANLVTLATDQNAFLAQVNRTALIIALESYFGRVQSFMPSLVWLIVKPIGLSST
jgi:hypothetical protein